MIERYQKGSDQAKPESPESRQYLKPPHFFKSWDSSVISPEENQKRHIEAEKALNYYDEVAQNFVDEYHVKLGSFKKIPDTFQKIIQTPEKRDIVFPGWSDDELDDLLDEVIRLSSENGDSVGENIDGVIEIPDVVPVAEKYEVLLKSLRERWQENQAITSSTINDLVIMARGGNPEGIRTKYFSNWEDHHFKSLVYDVTGMSIDDF